MLLGIGALIAISTDSNRRIAAMAARPSQDERILQEVDIDLTSATGRSIKLHVARHQSESIESWVASVNRMVKALESESEGIR